MDDTPILRHIPAIDRLLAATAGRDELSCHPRELLTAVLRQVTAQARDALRQGIHTDIDLEALLDRAQAHLGQVAQPSLKRVINATGVTLHTNLGRAPLSRRAKACLAGIIDGYSTLEYNVASGERGTRYAHVAERLCQLTGAQDALVVNNNAAAVLLVISTLAAGKEVIVSRGELVEIGGSFRVPDVIKQSGAQLVEVGSTNKTHLYDYERAIGPNTAAILKVHTSNYRIVGFTAQPDEAELVTLAHQHGLPVIEDLGSGTLLPLSIGGFAEPAVPERLALGFDIVTFSGDKLLGAGQAGIIAGKAEYITQMKKHSLIRAIRIDKLSLAALEGTLLDYQLGNPGQDIPVLKLLTASEAELKARAGQLARALEGLQAHGWHIAVVAITSPAGGGALPTAVLPGYGVTVSGPHLSAAAIENCLRQRPVPIIVRVQSDKVMLDVRCLFETDIEEIAQALSLIATTNLEKIAADQY